MKQKNDVFLTKSSKVFMKMVDSFPRLRKKMWKILYYFVAFMNKDQAWKFMNYGYLPSTGKPSLPLAQEELSEWTQIELYFQVAIPIVPRNKLVLEVGCGYGGGSRIINKYLEPEMMTGLDFSAKNISICKKTAHGVRGLEFVTGDAEAMPFSDRSFHAVLNVESSHCYSSMIKFLKEVHRVLKDEGTFSWVDFRKSDEIDATKRLFEEAGFNIQNHRDISRDVLRALDAESEKKVELLTKYAPNFMLDALKDFAGTKESFIHRSLSTSYMTYMHIVATKR